MNSLETHPVLQPVDLEKAAMKSAQNRETFSHNFDDSSKSEEQFQTQNTSTNVNSDNQQQQSNRIHFLPQQHSSPAFPVSSILSMSPTSMRRFSQQQSTTYNKSCWDESLEQLSRELQMICRSGSRESLNQSASNSRPSSPTKTSVTINLGCQTKETKSLSPSPTFNKDDKNNNARRVSLNIDFDHEALQLFGKSKKGEDKSLKFHRSHEDILEDSPPKCLKSILKSPKNQPQEFKEAEKPQEFLKEGPKESASPQQIREEIADQVFENETDFLKPNDFGYPELTLRKIKVRHEETEVSLNRTLAKICRSKNTFLIPIDSAESSNDCSLTNGKEKETDNTIESELYKLESPVVVVANIQQFLHQKHQESDQNDQLAEPVKIEQEILEKHEFTRVLTKTIVSSESRNSSFQQKSARYTQRNHVMFQDSATSRRSRMVNSSIQAYRQKKLFRLSQGAKSLSRSFENVRIKFEVDLKDRNPFSVSVSVDEETGFLTVFASTYNKGVNYDSGVGETPSVGSNTSDKFGENFLLQKQSISSDTSECSFTPSIEQLHLLRLGESTKPECLRCSIEDGILRIREIENEAEFLNFDGLNTKYLPIMNDDITNCNIVVTLFVPQEFRASVSVKTIDNILVLTGLKGQFSDKFGSRTSQDVSDDDDGYDAASELSSHSSLAFTPPATNFFIPCQTPPAGRGSLSSISSSTQAIPIPSQSNQPATQTFKVALNLPPETITRTIEAWMADCGQLIVTGQTTGVGRRMTCNF